MSFEKRKVYAAAALGMSFLKADSYSGTYISPNDAAIEQKAFTKVKNYWVAQGIGEVASTKLVLLSGHDVAYCGGKRVDAQDDIALHCHKQKTVLITATFLEHLPNKSTLHKAAQEAVLAHELGHAVQDSQGLIDHNKKLSLDKVDPVEISADCLAGTAMQVLYPQDVRDAEHFFKTLTNEYLSHGTNLDRLRSFTNGEAKQDCLQPIRQK